MTLDKSILLKMAMLPACIIKNQPDLIQAIRKGRILKKQKNLAEDKGNYSSPFSYTAIQQQHLAHANLYDILEEYDGQDLSEEDEEEPERKLQPIDKLQMVACGNDQQDVQLPKWFCSDEPEEELQAVQPSACPDWSEPCNLPECETCNKGESSPEETPKPNAGTTYCPVFTGEMVLPEGIEPAEGVLQFDKDIPI